MIKLDLDIIYKAIENSAIDIAATSDVRFKVKATNEAYAKSKQDILDLDIEDKIMLYQLVFIQQGISINNQTRNNTAKIKIPKIGSLVRSELQYRIKTYVRESIVAGEYKDFKSDIKQIIDDYYTEINELKDSGGIIDISKIFNKDEITQSIDT